MAQVRDHLADSFVNRAVEQLDDELNLGVALYAFARTWVDRPENWAKIEGSYSGHALNLLVLMTLRELRLWCARLLENNGHSLLNVVTKRLPNLTEEIVQARLLAHPDWSDRMLGVHEVTKRVEQLQIRALALKECDAARALLKVRNEHYAHLLSGVTRYEEVEHSWNDILSLAYALLECIVELKFIWRFHSHTLLHSIEAFQNYCEEFWSILPNLSEAEKERASDRLLARFPDLFKNDD